MVKIATTVGVLICFLHVAAIPVLFGFAAISMGAFEFPKEIFICSCLLSFGGTFLLTFLGSNKNENNAAETNVKDGE
jgi:hypothetical protein